MRERTCSRIGYLRIDVETCLNEESSSAHMVSVRLEQLREVLVFTMIEEPRSMHSVGIADVGPFTAA